MSFYTTSKKEGAPIRPGGGACLGFLLTSIQLFQIRELIF
jgi:hypothetical protein